ncbi:ABC transporter substrate-binding protein [Nocardioides sp. Root140]|uniref:ABC transporter substrate-binding protein n=1 Tax=Nocardioides sp. Root140 TaxID=1736460 RepID=UPI0006F94610|nr:ABC transporter substrate-binding protein [Nocardioides sp. Root140]KQY57159.1 hypothetical protein ASD30_13000 [Nocardioides sp. Root140]
MNVPHRQAWLRLLTAAVALCLLSACTSAVGEQARRRSSGEPVDGGTLRVAALTDLIPASVFGQSSNGGNAVIGLVYDSLVEYPHDSLEARPALATSWKVAKDGRSIHLELRDDVRFHDGKPFTSEDVKFSIRTIADPKWAVQLQRTAAAVTGFDTSDPHAITLTFDRPLSNILDLLDIVPIVDKDTFSQVKAGTGYNGTGAFRFDEWKPNSEISFSRNDDYWGGKPHLDGVDVKIVPDPQAQAAGIRSGQYDLLLGATARDAETFSKDPKYEVLDFEGATQQTYVGFNLKNPDLKDVRLRQAVAFAVDRERILDEVYRGEGIAQNLSWSPGSPAYDEKAAHHYDRDVDKARELVDGLGSVASLPLQYIAGDPTAEAVAQIVQANLDDVGITVDLEPVEYAQMYQRLVGADYDGLWIFGHTYAQYTPATLPVSAYPFNAEHNASNFLSPGYAAHADQAWAAAAPDGPKAKRAYAGLNADMVDNVWLTDLVTFWPRLVTTSAIHDIDYTKRTELIARDAWKDQ